MTRFGSELAGRGRFLLFLLGVTLGSMALVLLLAFLWHTWGFVAALVPFLVWLFLARGWLVFALFVAFDAVWFAASRHVVVLPQLARLAEQEEQDRKYFKTRTSRREGAHIIARVTALTNPFTPVLFMSAGFLARCPEAEGAPMLVQPGGGVPARDAFSDWHRIRGHRAPA